MYACVGAGSWQDIEKPKAVLTLSYSSKINDYLYHQRVSLPLKKTP
jgi:hypothetical protein